MLVVLASLLLRRALFTGPFFQDMWGMWASATQRYYVLFIAQYFWAFHYGRPALRALSGLLPSSKAAARSASLLCLGAAAALECLDVRVLGSSGYYHMLEEWGGGQTPQLLLLSLEMLLYTAIVLALAVAAAGWRKPPQWVRTAGSTTLGCYVMHWYFMPITGYLNEPWAGEGGLPPFAALQDVLGSGLGVAAQARITPACMRRGAPTRPRTRGTHARACARASP